MTILGGALICIVFFISCKNFMNASDVKREIEEAIEIANSNPVTYYVVADKDSGTVTPAQLRLKKKETFEIKFTPSDNWTFLGWEVLDRSTGQSVTNSLSFEDSTKTETKGTVIEPRENLEIHAKCVQLPCITGYYPPDYPTGIEQDSIIKIYFNKPVNPQSFGNFRCITITTPSGSLDAYYDTPYFSDDNKTLNIPPVKEKQILSSDTLVNIAVSIDLSNIIDEEGIQMTGKQSYTFRINKNKDTKIPEFTKTELYSTSDTTSNFYRQLTDKALTEWDDSSITGYNFGDVSKNHCFSSVYYDFDGYDSQSGLSSLRITETYLKTASGTDITKPSVYTEYSNLDGIYTFRNDNDGLIKLDFQLLDYAGNASIPKTYYVIKDSKSHLKVYNKLPESVNGKYAMTGDNGVNEVLKKMYIEFNDTFATLNGKTYKYNLNDSDIKIFTKPDYNSVYSEVRNYNYVTTETENPYIWFTYNEFSDTSNSYIKVIITNPEAVKEREFEVPKTPKVTSIQTSSGSWYQNTQSGNCSFNLHYNVNSESFYLAEDTLCYCFYYYSNNSPASIPVNSYDYNFSYFDTYSTSTYTLTPEIAYNNSTYTTIYSGMYASYDIYEEESFKIYSLQNSLPYFKNFEIRNSRHGTLNTTIVKKPVLSISAVPGPKSSGKYIIQTQVTNLDPDANISFQVIYKSWGHDYPYAWSDQDDRTFTVSSSTPEEMEIRVRAIRLVNGLFYYNDSEWHEFTINEDNCPPSITDHSTDYSADSKKLTNISDLYDSGYDAGLLYDENNNHNIKYWIIPFNLEVYNKQEEKLTKDYVNSFHPREHLLSIPKSLIEDDEGDWEFFDISNLTDGKYMLVAENWDKNDNCNFEIAWCFEVGSLTKPLSITRNEDTFTITAEDETIPFSDGYTISKRVFVEYYDLTKKRWVEKWDKSVELPATGDKTFTYTPAANKFIKIYKYYDFTTEEDYLPAHRVTYPQYIWTGSNSTCLVKEIHSISDDIVAIRCDNACVLETAISSVNYDDPHKWDLYATKKKPEMITSSDFYFMDTSDIYEGDYYCTIAHFADGTILLSEIHKQY